MSDLTHSSSVSVELGEAKQDGKHHETKHERLGSPDKKAIAHDLQKEAENRRIDMILSSVADREMKRDWIGVMTLLMLGASAIVGIVLNHNQAYWIILPFCSVIIGAWGGVVWEVFGHLGSRWQDTVTAWRSANVGLVAGTFLYLFIRLSFLDGSIKHDDAVLWAVSFIGTFLFVNSFLGRSPFRGSIAFLFSAIAMIVVILKSDWAPDSPNDKYWLLATAICFILSLLKQNIVWFHFINSVGTACLVVGLRNAHTLELDYVWRGNIGYLFLGLFTGLIAVFIRNPLAWSEFHNMFAGFVWSLLLRLLLKLPPWEPAPLTVEKNLRQPYIHTVPYYTTHGATAPGSWPSALIIPLAQQRDYAFTKFLFGVVAWWDKVIPRARTWVPLKDKPRLLKYQLNEYYWYPLLVSFVPIMTSPKTARLTYESGQLLEYLVLYDHCSTMLVRCESEHELKRGTHKLDFTFMEKYKCKEDYNQCGGKAYFRLQDNKDGEPILPVTGVCLPFHDDFIPTDPESGRFRQAESIVIASSFMEVVAGYHLMGIHVCMNLVSIALNNAFDTTEQFHPFRVIMNVHFFNHVFVNELTTAHLLSETAVFAQIFPTTFYGLCDYLNDKYVNFEYARDCKCEERQAMLDGRFPKHSQLAWEKPYTKVYRQYGDEIADAIWASDEAVQQDRLIQNFAAEMNKRIVLGLPPRHNFQTKKGVARFIADSIYVVTVRHEVYGTKATMPGMDPHIMNSQVPRDFGADAIEVYNSILWVGLATSQANFAKLRQDFKFQLGVIADETVRTDLGRAMDNFQHGLSTIQKEFEHDYDYDYLKTMPSQLETGAGY